MNRKSLSSRLFLICAVALVTGAAIIILSRIWPDDSPDKIDPPGLRAENSDNGPNVAGPAKTAQDPPVVGPKNSDSLLDGHEDKLFKSLRHDVEHAIGYEASKLVNMLAGEWLSVKNRGLDPNVAMVRSLPLLKELYEENKGRRYNRHECELLFAAEKIAARAEGTAQWPEAMLYLGLCHEANGHHYRSGGSQGRLIYQRALAASPPPPPNIRRQLQLRVAMHDLGGMLAAKRWSLEREKRVAKTRQILEQLSKEDLKNVKTMSGRPMDQTVELLLESCSAPHSIAGVRARLELLRDVFSWPLAHAERVNLGRSIENDLYTTGNEDYQRYLSDASITSSEKASLEIDLADLDLDNRGNRQRAIVHAENALRFAGGDQTFLQIRAKAVLAAAYAALGQSAKAAALVHEIRASKDFKNLSAQRQRQMHNI